MYAGCFFCFLFNSRDFVPKVGEPCLWGGGGVLVNDVRLNLCAPNHIESPPRRTSAAKSQHNRLIYGLLDENQALVIIPSPAHADLRFLS